MPAGPFGSDLDRRARRDPGRQRRDAEPAFDRRQHGGHAAADEGLAPGDAGALERVDRMPAQAAFGHQIDQRQRPFRSRQGRRCEPAEEIAPQHLAGAARHQPTDDRDVELAALEGGLQRRRGLDAQADHQGRIVPRQPGQQSWSVGPDRLFADADGDALAGLAEGAERPLMRRHQLARRRQEALALGREPDQPRMALQQNLAEPLFQSLNPGADQRLRRAERLGGAGEARKFGRVQEGGDGVEIKSGAHHKSSFKIIDIIKDTVFRLNGQA